MWLKTFQWFQILYQQPTFEQKQPSENNDNCFNDKSLSVEIPSMDRFSFFKLLFAIIALAILEVISIDCNFSEEKRPEHVVVR